MWAMQTVFMPYLQLPVCFLTLAECKLTFRCRRFSDNHVEATGESVFPSEVSKLETQRFVLILPTEKLIFLLLLLLHLLFLLILIVLLFALFPQAV